MRLVVVCATGGLGCAVLGSALARGHAVSALVRNPQTGDLPAEVRSLPGDVLDPASMEPAVGGRDAVVCALGTPSPRTVTTLLEEGTANLVEVMTRLQVSRLVCVTLLGVGQIRANTALLYRHILLRLLAPMVPDKQNTRSAWCAPPVDWVLVRPPTFVGFGSRGRVRVIREGAPGRVGLVIRSELADLLVDAAETDEYLRERSRSVDDEENR